MKDNRELTKKDPQMAISIADSFGEIYEAIEDLESVPGTSRTYSSDQLIKIIERVRHLHRPLDRITRTHGIRNAVEGLLKNDDTYKKALKRRDEKEERHQKKNKRKAA